jgi:uncharacterized protein YegP (UPF0339 family)
MAAKYDLKKTADGQFMFNLKAANGEVILTSERYTTKASAENGIESVKTNAPNDEQYDRRTSTVASARRAPCWGTRTRPRSCRPISQMRLTRRAPRRCPSRDATGRRSW